MNIFQRFKIAWDLVGFGDTKTTVAASLQETWKNEQAVYPELNFESFVRHGWRKNELIFASISKTANTAAQVELDVFPLGSTEAMSEHPLRMLIRKPNKYMTEFDFWSAIIIYQKLYGRAYFEKERTRGGQVIALWPLRPDWVHPVPATANDIAYYEYAPPGINPPARIPVEDVLDFKLWDPMGMFSTWSPSAVAARTGDIDNATTDFLKLFFQKGGTPPGVLKTVQKLKDAQVEIIRRRWAERYGGYENWLQPAVLDADATYQRIGLTFEEMGFGILDSRNEARICMVMDIPPILVGAKVGLDRATYSNYGEARRAWWEDSLMPMYVNFGDTIENQLVPDFGGNITTAWNWLKVPALQEERSARWQRATAAFNAGAITINEFRFEIGLPSIGSSGDVYVRNPAFVTVRAGADESEPELEPEADDEEKGLEITVHIGHNHNGKDGRVAESAPDDEDRLAFERELAAKLATFLEGQKKRIRKAVNAS
jgi:HK97 family phage portal protein